MLETEQGISGYAAAWRNLPSSAIIGPVVAPDVEAAKRLVADLAAKVSGTIRLDLDPDRSELHQALAETYVHLNAPGMAAEHRKRAEATQGARQ